MGPTRRLGQLATCPRVTVRHRLGARATQHLGRVASHRGLPKSLGWITPRRVGRGGQHGQLRPQTLRKHRCQPRRRDPRTPQPHGPPRPSRTKRDPAPGPLEAARGSAQAGTRAGVQPCQEAVASSAPLSLGRVALPERGESSSAIVLEPPGPAGHVGPAATADNKRRTRDKLVATVLHIRRRPTRAGGAARTLSQPDARSTRRQLPPLPAGESSGTMSRWAGRRRSILPYLLES